jgi:hypothetical protein
MSDNAMDERPYAGTPNTPEVPQNSTGAASETRHPADNDFNRDRRPRHSQDHLGKFRGNRSLFRTWKLRASGKLKADANAIGTPLEQVIYLFGALEGKAASTVEAYVEHCLNQDAGDPWEVLRRLDTAYGDRNLESRATTELFSISMAENETFTDFYPRFELKLSQAGGHNWPPVVCRNALRNALSKKMARAACGSAEPEQFADYVMLLKDISVRMELYGEFDTRRPGMRNQVNRATAITKTVDAIAAAPDDADVEMVDAPHVHVNSTRVGPVNPSGYPSRRPEDRQLIGKRAQWVSRDVYDKRRDEGRCLRCGRDGCRVDRCPLKPALNPNGRRKVRINNTQSRRLVTEAAVADDDEESDSENE